MERFIWNVYTIIGFFFLMCFKYNKLLFMKIQKTDTQLFGLTNDIRNFVRII